MKSFTKLVLESDEAENFFNMLTGDTPSKTPSKVMVTLFFNKDAAIRYITTGNTIGGFATIHTVLRPVREMCSEVIDDYNRRYPAATTDFIDITLIETIQNKDLFTVDVRNNTALYTVYRFIVMESN